MGAIVGAIAGTLRPRRLYGPDQWPIAVPPVPALIAAGTASIATRADQPIAPAQPEDADGNLVDVPPSVALRIRKATGHPHAHYLPHLGKRQIARQARQDAARRQRAERTAASA